VEQSGFQVELSKDISGFDAFYHDMFKAYIRSRHGKCSVVDAYDKLRKRFEKDGEILFITEEGRRVAGMMISYQNNKAAAHRLGILDGDFKWVEKGAISALYHHTIRHCRALGFKKLHVGGSRPFFSDGVLNYKMKNWNMRIDDYARQFYFLLKPQTRSPFALQFLTKNSLVSLEKNRMVATTFAAKADRQPNLEKIRNNYAEKGLSNIKVYNL
jgi:hypothetical protein